MCYYLMDLVYKQYKWMVNNLRKIFYPLLILFAYLLIQSNCQISQKQHNLYFNYIQESEPLELRILIKNSTKTVFEKNYTIIYSTEKQPEIQEMISIPVDIDMENYTVFTELYKQNKKYPVQSSYRNLTRMSKVRKQSDFTASVEMEGISNKVDENTKYGMHLPHKFVVMPIYMQDVIHYSIRQYINFFKFKPFRADKLYYIPPIDLSQLHIPFKQYKYLDTFVNQQTELSFLEKQSNFSVLPIQTESTEPPINDTETYEKLVHNSYNYNFTLIIRVYPFHYFQFLYGFTDLDLLRKHAPMHMQDIYTDDMIDMIKQMFFQNNFYFVILYFVLTVVQCFMQFFAFKNQIKVWQEIQTTGGLSIKSLYQWLGCYVVMLLYLIDQQANMLYIVFIVIDIVITIWKIGKAIKVTTKEGFPFIKLGYKDWYHNKTQSADTQATSYTSKLITILFSLFMLYKLYSPIMYVIGVLTKENGNGIADIVLPKFSVAYTFILESFFGFILVFGFVMITPQLYINYKLKSVDHLPWKTLIYRFISTIIDDIFVFMISLPWMQRAFSFRDDVVFVIYLIQRRMYRVDKNRLALGGGSVDLAKIKDKQKLKLLQSFQSQQQHTKTE